MSRTIAYHRPASIEEALDLLGSPGQDGAERTLLAGGTVVNATGGPAIEVVDLQALGLDGIGDQAPPTEHNAHDAEDAHAEGTIEIGSMVRLQDIAENESLPPAIRDAARSELPSTLRTIATVGGTVGARSAESVLLAALLAHGATVAARSTEGRNTRSLASWLADDISQASIITSVTIVSGGRTAVASTGRTPADVPIVAAIGRRTADSTFIALTGVADTPVTVDAADPTAGLSPRADFRGSVEYRLELARVLTTRVLEELSR